MSEASTEKRSKVDYHGIPHFDVAELERVIDRWFESACDCCSPTGLDEGIEADELRWRAMADKTRRFAIELAQAAQWAIDEDRAERSSDE